MQRKPFFIIALVLALAAALWLGLHRNVPKSKPAVAGFQPKTVAPPPPLLANPVKLVSIAGPPQQPAASAANPVAATAWTDIQVVVDTKAPYAERLKAMRRLPARLSEADAQALERFLLQKTSADQEQLEKVLKNQVMDRLCALEPPPASLGKTLTGLYQDLEQSPVLRDYAVQHLAAYNEALEGEKGRAANLERQKVQQVLWQALKETDSSIAGTALLGLKRLAEAGAQIDANRLGQAALGLAQSASAGELAQITAYQVCGQLQLKEALPALAVAAQHSRTVSQQISAIGSVGMLGGSAEVPLLQNLLAGDEARLKPAVDHALAQIAARQGQMGSPR